MEIEYYKELRISEFLGLAWDNNPEKAKKINELIGHYNKMSMWVATEIITSSTPKIQAKVIAKFLRTAQRLFDMKNYASCAQLIAGVSTRAVQRLKKVQKLLDWKTAERYEQLNNNFDPVSGYSNYRNKLNHGPPTIPFIGMFIFKCYIILYFILIIFLAVTLRTLTLIEEGNPKHLNGNKEVISFARLVMYAECIAKLRLDDSSMIDYNIEPNPEIQNQLRNVSKIQFEFRI